MIQIEEIVTAFEDTVRFQQTENPDAPKLTDALTLPLTARLVYHPVLRNENLAAIAPNYDTMNWPAWADGAYAAGVTVSHLNSNWTATEAILAGETPGTSSKWSERAKLDSYLRERRREAIRTAILDIYNTKKEKHIARETLGDIMLYDGAGNMNDLNINNGQLVGLELQILENTGLEVAIKQLAMQMSGPETFNMYLWHSSQTDPIATIPIAYTKTLSVEWLTVSKNLKYRDFTNGHDNGLYYLGYYQDDLSEQSVRKRFNFGTIPCGTCNQYNKTAYQKYSQYIRVRAFRISNPPAGLKLWTIENTVYEPDNNWGMNLRLQPNCNITQYIIDRKEVFADVISHQLKYGLLMEVANSVRSNVLSEQVVEMARGAIQPEHLGGEGVPKQLDKAKAAAGLEMSDIEKNVCMPRSKPRGVSTNNIRTGGGASGYKSSTRFR